MPEKYQLIFKNKLLTATIRDKAHSREIRCRIDGRTISACGKNTHLAVLRFIGKLQELENENSKDIAFRDYASQWLETVKKPNVKPITYADYLSAFNAGLFPAFGDRRLSEIRPFHIQTYINGLLSSDKPRAARKHFQLLKAVFDYAVIDGIVPRSPMEKIVVPFHEEEHGIAFTKDEEKAFIEKCLKKTRKAARRLSL